MRTRKQERFVKPTLIACLTLGCLAIAYLTNLNVPPILATAQLNTPTQTTDGFADSGDTPFLKTSAIKSDILSRELPPVSEATPVSVRTPSTAKQETAKQADAGPKLFDLTFDDLKFEMEKGSKFARSMLTKTINGYNGGTVKLRGYIRPAFTQTGLTKFIFVRDNKECCFGPGAALYDCVLVKLAKNVKTDYTVRPITIQGKFSLKEYKGPDGKVWAIYRMNNASVK